MSTNVTKLYLTNRTAPYTPATIRGTWDSSASIVTRALDATTVNGGVVVQVSQLKNVATNPWTSLLYRGISGPLAAQTIGGNLSFIIGARESATTADMCFRVHAYVTQGDTDTPRGTLVNNYADTTPEWGTAYSGVQLGTAQALSLAVSSGDRLVVEIGYIARQALTTQTGLIFCGTLGVLSGGEKSDLTAGASLPVSPTTTESGFVGGQLSFSSGLLLEDIPTRTSQAVVESIAQPSPNSIITQYVVESVTTSAAAAGIRTSQFVIESIAVNTVTSTETTSVQFFMP